MLTPYEKAALYPTNPVISTNRSEAKGVER
jgi:hypothetical protein